MKVLKSLMFLALMMPFMVQAQTTTKPASPSKSTKKELTKKKKSATVPVAAAKATTPVGESKPVMTFSTKYVNFGKIKTGDKPSQTFEFTNTGNADLDIDLVSGCDCTELDWTRSTVKPGQKGFVKAIFNTVKAEKEDHKKPLTKYVTIILKQINPKNDAPINDEVKFDVFIVD
jgi:Protein of unknown function (DUF1573)